MQIGREVRDTHNNEDFLMKCKLARVLLDSRALKSGLSVGEPGSKDCFKCTDKGFTIRFNNLPTNQQTQLDEPTVAAHIQHTAVNVNSNEAAEDNEQIICGYEQAPTYDDAEEEEQAEAEAPQNDTAAAVAAANSSINANTDAAGGNKKERAKVSKTLYYPYGRLLSLEDPEHVKWRKLCSELHVGYKGWDGFEAAPPTMLTAAESRAAAVPLRVRETRTKEAVQAAKELGVTGYHCLSGCGMEVTDQNFDIMHAASGVMSQIRGMMLGKGMPAAKHGPLFLKYEQEVNKRFLGLTWNPKHLKKLPFVLSPEELEIVQARNARIHEGKQLTKAFVILSACLVSLLPATTALICSAPCTSQSNKCH
jgi:hypothetical protein